MRDRRYIDREVRLEANRQRFAATMGRKLQQDRHALVYDVLGRWASWRQEHESAKKQSAKA